MSRTTTFYVPALRTLSNGQTARTYAPMRGVPSHDRYGASQDLSYKLQTLGAHQPRVRAS